MNATRLTTDELRERVLSNTGSDGRLKNETFDLDARAVVILSKRHQISVRRALFTFYKSTLGGGSMRVPSVPTPVQPMHVRFTESLIGYRKTLVLLLC